MAMPIQLRLQHEDKRDRKSQRRIDAAFGRENSGLPAEWAEVKPWPENLLSAADEVEVEWRTIPQSLWGINGDMRLIREQLDGWQPLDEEALTSGGALLAVYGRWADRMGNLGEYPDYGVELFTPPVPLERAGGYQAQRLATELLQLRADIAAHEGRFGEAFSHVSRVGSLARQHPAGSIMGSLISTVTTQRAAKALYRIGVQCDDPLVLRRGILACPHPLGAGVLADHPSIQLLDAIGTLHSMQREGNPVRMNIDASPLEIYGDSVRARLDFESWMKETIPDMDNRRRYLANQSGIPLNINKVELAVLSAGPFWKRVILEKIFEKAEANPQEILTRERTAVAFYDLATLELRQRACILEGGTRDIEAPPEPSDPYSDEPYSFNYERGVFYSWGPDYDDNEGTILYDPTNGTDSSGDIFVPAKSTTP